MKTLIIYYSQNGTTRLVSETLANKLNADIIGIKDLKPRDGFKSKITSSFDAFRENKTDVEPMRIDVSGYDLIYIGSPVWAGKPTPAIITIIDRCDLRSKDVVLFATMSTSGGQATVERMGEKTKARGARIIETFTVRTKNKTLKQLVTDTETIVDILDLDLYK